RPDRVHQAFAGDVRRGAVNRLEEAASGLWVDVSGRRDAHPADQLRGEVAEDVAEQVAGDDDVELAWVPDQLHGGRIDEEMAGLDFRVLSRHGLPALLPEPARIGHGVRLVGA